ncbi:MAG: hypothetical protein FWD71_06340 [Oscillospiraceae bacterium]|nr:hypothetical protein [Oscillospiraceae bacterium]
MEIDKINITADRASTHYNIESYNILKVHNSSHGDDDLRYTYILQNVATGYKIALKITKNCFTTPERVAGWAQLAEHYNNLGIYAPHFLKNTTNTYSLNVDEFIVYAEECYEGKTEEDAESKDESVRTDVLKSLGLVAANPAPLVPWHTMWCLYDKFDENDLYDENLMCATDFTKYAEKNLPAYEERARKILSKYQAMRTTFEAKYRSLPRAVFQGDLNSTNILLTNERKFKGLCDFNLSGTETILNNLFCECCECWNGEEEEKITRLSDVSAQYEFDNKAAKELAVVGEYYKFNDNEKSAFTTYYNITYPFRWINYGFYMYHLRESGMKYAPDIFTWIERQMNRTDVYQLLP